MLTQKESLYPGLHIHDGVIHENHLVSLNSIVKGVRRTSQVVLGTNSLLVFVQVIIVL